MASVSVIIPSYNQAEFLPEAVHSVLEQTFDDLEIIIVDDCSTDDSPATALALQKEAPEKITVLKNAENMGVSRTRNRGAGQAQGNFLAFLDSDDCWLPEKLERQLDFFRAHPDTGFVHSKVRLLADEASRSWLSSHSNYLLKSVDHLEEAINSFCDRAAEFSRLDYFRSLYDSNCICAASTLVRNDIFKKSGGFDHGLSSQSEDWLLWLKACMYAPPGVMAEPTTMYRFHPANHTATMFARPDFDFNRSRDEVRSAAEAHDPERFHECLKECGAA